MTPVFTQQVQLLLRQNMAALVISLVCLLGALAALALWLGRSRLRERILLWFGLFALLYSVREVIRNPLIQLTFGIPPHFWDYLVSWGDFLVVIPAWLFFEEIFGRGWRSSTHWAFWVLTAYSGVALLLGILTGKPYFWPEPSVPVLLPLVLIATAVRIVNRQNIPPLMDAPILFLGAGTFVVFVIGQHIVASRFHVEPVGFFALICSLGLVAARRTMRNEKKLLSVEEELASARRIQASILPSGVPEVSGLDIAARYSPMTSVAGDFYDFAAIDSSRAGILIADVAGHGVPAALIASMVKVAFAAQNPHAGDPGRVLSGLNEIFCSQLRGQYVTAGYLVIDHRASSATYAGAGHPPLIHWRASMGKVERRENNGLFLGFRIDAVYPNVEISLAPGDRLILYTDGLLEATNRADENFGDRLDARIAAHRHLPVSAFADALLADLRAWTGASDKQQEDDLTLLVVDVRPQASSSNPGPVVVQNLAIA